MDSVWPRRIRLITGIIIFAFVVSHLLNLSLGLISVDMMDRFLPVFMAPWYNPVGSVALFGSLALHMAFALHALFMRRTLRMTRFDAVQLVMALALPPLLVAHILGTRVANAIYGFDPTYAWMLVLFWKLMPLAGLRQLLVLIVAWVHGCMGLYYWLRLQPWWSRWEGYIYPLAFIIPVLALLGFVEGGKDALNRVNTTPGWLDALITRAQPIDKLQELVAQETRIISVYVGVIGLVLLARAIRLKLRSVSGAIEISYIDGPNVVGPPGLSLLEISRREDIPHVSRCGGRGRCTTCRVRVTDGLDRLPVPSALELQALTNINAAPDTRLACQVIPIAPLTIERIVIPDSPASELTNAHGDTLRQAGLIHLEYPPGTHLQFMQRLLDALREADVQVFYVSAHAVSAVVSMDAPIHRATADISTLLARLVRPDQSPPLGAIVHVGPVRIGSLAFGDEDRLTVEGDGVDVLHQWRTKLSTEGSVTLVTEPFAAASSERISTDGILDADSPVVAGRWQVAVSVARG
ncbi:MAG: 2Fe-2S iron-sulfur cluster-binding protein [Pseudomonadota bacterium]